MDLPKLAADYAGRVAFAAVATAAFTGLRLADFEDSSGGTSLTASCLSGEPFGEPKKDCRRRNPARTVLSVLKAILESYRMHLEGPPEEGHLGKELKPIDWMFAGERRGTSMNLPNLVRRTIIPNLTRCSVCHAPEHLHKEQNKDHAFELDESIPKWKGWHGFRRSLASNLYTLGVKPKLIQAIVRHSDIATTLSFYVETPEAESRDALDKLMGLMQNRGEPK